MPIDPATLRTVPFRAPTPEPTPRPWWKAPLVFLTGSMILGAAALAAWGNATLTAIYLLVAVLASIVGTVIAFCGGWAQGGFLNARYRADHPLGTTFAGDEERDGMVVARWWLLGVAIILAGVLSFKRPDAWDNLRHGRFSASPGQALPVPGAPR